MAEMGHGGGLLEAQVRRHARELVRFRGGVLGERSPACPEHRLARFESRHLRTDRLDDPGQLRTQPGDLRPAQPVAGGPEQVGQAGHDVPRAPVQAGRTDAHEHLFIPDIGHFHIAEAQDVGRAIPVAHDRLHRALAVPCKFGSAAALARISCVVLSISSTPIKRQGAPGSLVVQRVEDVEP